MTGAARYLDDVVLPGMAYVAILRSPHAHARIKGIDTSRAAAAPGVVGVFTGQDFADVPSLPCAWQAGGVTNNVVTPRVLELDKVSHMGAGVAAVVADTREQAEDALGLIDVDYEVLGVLISSEAAVQPGAVQIHENAPNNVVMEWTCGDAAATDAALAAAEVRISQRLINQRLIPTPMEARGAIGQYIPATEEYTVWMTSQAPHVMRLLMTAFVLGIHETKMRTLSPQVGGGFGAKIFLYPEYPLMALLAKATGRPVKWAETRWENYAATTHGRDHISDVEIGCQQDGTVTALKVDTLANLGGVLSTIAPGIPTTLYGRMLSGPYTIPNIACRVRGVYTNTGMVDAYRGAGRPEATYVLERSMDLVAGEDRHRSGRGAAAQLHRARGVPLHPVLERPERPPLRHRRVREAARPGPRDGRLRGVPGRAGAGPQGRSLPRHRLLDLHRDVRRRPVRLDRDDGRGLGRRPLGERERPRPPDRQGRGHHRLPVARPGARDDDGPGGRRRARHPRRGRDWSQHSDSLGTPFGYGTYGSRSAAVGTMAIHTSLQRIKEKARRIGAHMLEAPVEDVIYEDGKVFVKGSPASMKTIQDIAAAAAVGYSLPAGDEPFLDDTAYYDPPNCTYPFGTHVAMVEIDPDTGEVTLQRYVAVDDVGKVINPLIVDGQVHGGIAQGVAQALWEGASYDEDGRLQTASLMDYALPEGRVLPAARDRPHRDADRRERARREGRRRGRARSPRRRRWSTRCSTR